MNLKTIKILFLIAGLYDIILGVVYFFWYHSLFALFSVPPAGHPTYVQFPALLLVLFGIMFIQIGTDPARYRVMIPYGMGLKAAFAGLAFWYEFNGGVSAMWIPMALIDLLFLIAFIVAWLNVGGTPREA